MIRLYNMKWYEMMWYVIWYDMIWYNMICYSCFIDQSFMVVDTLASSWSSCLCGGRCSDIRGGRHPDIILIVVIIICHVYVLLPREAAFHKSAMIRRCLAGLRQDEYKMKTKTKRRRRRKQDKDKTKTRRIQRWDENEDRSSMGDDAPLKASHKHYVYWPVWSMRTDISAAWIPK